jgi:hypothetical protein
MGLIVRTARCVNLLVLHPIHSMLLSSEIIFINRLMIKPIVLILVMDHAIVIIMFTEVS